jgi:hypothetical protein
MLDTILHDKNNYIVDVVSIRVYVFSNHGLLGSIVGRTLWMLKELEKLLFLETMRLLKRT